MSIRLLGKKNCISKGETSSSSMHSATIGWGKGEEIKQEGQSTKLQCRGE